MVRSECCVSFKVRMRGRVVGAYGRRIPRDTAGAPGWPGVLCRLDQFELVEHPRVVGDVAQGEVFDKAKYEEVLTKLEGHEEQIFGELPLHYEQVGHWLQKDASTKTVDVLLDFK